MSKRLDTSTSPYYPQNWETFPPESEDFHWKDVEKLIGNDDDVGMKMGFVRWIMVRNTKNGETFYLRLSRNSKTAPFSVSALIRPWLPEKPITSQTFRNLPLATIARAEERMLGEWSWLARQIIYADKAPNFKEPFKPLPKPNLHDDAFLYAATWQYLSLLHKHPDENPVKAMQKINGGKSRSYVQSWLTAARKRRILGGAPIGGRSSHHQSNRKGDR